MIREIGELTILGSTIEANGSNHCPGIGAGLVSANSFSCIDKILIENSTVVGTGSRYAAWVGAGAANGNGSSSVVRHLWILSSVMNVSGLVDGGISPWVGTGCVIRGGTSVVDDIMIWNSNLMTYGCLSGSRIGTGKARNGTSSIGSLVIASSTVNASVSSGDCGIGARGINRGGISRIADLLISNSTVVAGPMSRCIIGSGLAGGEVGRLLFSGSCLIECQGNGPVAAVNASWLSLSSASLMFVSGEADRSGENFDLVLGSGKHGPHITDAASSLRSLFVEMRDLSLGDGGTDIRAFRFCVGKGDFWRCYSDTKGRVRNVIVTDGWNSLIGAMDVPVSSGTRHVDESFQAYVRPANESFIESLGTEPTLPIRLADSFMDVVEAPFASEVVRASLFGSVSQTGSIDNAISHDHVETSPANDSEPQWRDGRGCEWPDVAEKLGCNRTVCQESHHNFQESKKNMIAFLDQLPSKEPRRLWEEGAFSYQTFSVYFNQIDWAQFNVSYRQYVSSSESFFFHCTALCQKMPAAKRST
jgi:hypothetical protein